MELWIRSQDKEKLVKVNYLYLTDFNNRYGVYGETIDSNVKLGYYNSKERALEVLDEIDEFIDLFNRKGFGNVFSDDGVHEKHTIYHMPKE